MSDKKKMQAAISAISATIETLRVKISVAQSFNDDGDPEEALKYLRDIHAISYVGENDYK